MSGLGEREGGEWIGPSFPYSTHLSLSLIQSTHLPLSPNPLTSLSSVISDGIVLIILISAIDS